MSYDHTELFTLVRTLLTKHDEEHLRNCIQQCHNGVLLGPITQENLHLFRRYRNDPKKGSGGAQIMIDAAKDATQYRIEVNTAGDPPESWSHSAIRFTDSDEAHDYAKDLFMRWTAVKWWRVIDDDDKVAFSNKEGEVNEDVPIGDSSGAPSPAADG